MKTITFYSYKGGVGRSLALATIASRLAEFGKRVCLLDFDLEAPGLDYKFASYLKEQKIVIDKGIVDYVYQFTNTGSLAASLAEFSYPFLNSPKSYYTTLIPAGNINSPDYWKKLSSINWYDLLYENSTGLTFLLDLKEKIRKQFSPDYLLVDSRTGISEMSGITLSLLADEVVIVAANNRENLEGAKKIIRSITNPNNVIVGKIPKVTFVLSRVPFTNEPEDQEREQNLITKILREFDNLIDNVNIIHSDRDLELNEQIKIAYEKDEKVAQISLDYLKLFEKLTIDDLKPEEKNRFKSIKDSKMEYEKALIETSDINKLQYIDKAIELNDANSEFFLYRATIYNRLGDWNQVVNNCDSAINLDTSNIPAYEMKGQAQCKLKDYKNAKNTFEIILGWDKNQMNAKLGLAEIFTREDNYNKALSYYNEVILMDAENPIGYTGRANVNIKFGNYLSALDDIYQALAYDSKFVEAFLALAEINAHINNKNEFYLNLEKALQLDSKMVETFIKDQNIYKKFKDERVLKIISKYNIKLENED